MNQESLESKDKCSNCHEESIFLDNLCEYCYEEDLQGKYEEKPKEIMLKHGRSLKTNPSLQRERAIKKVFKAIKKKK